MFILASGHLCASEFPLCFQDDHICYNKQPRGAEGEPGTTEAMAMAAIDALLKQRRDEEEAMILLALLEGDDE